MILRNFLAGFLRRPGSADPGREDQDGGGAMQDAVRAALYAILREPLAHPANVDYELVARLKAAADAADYLVAHMIHARNLVHRAELLAFALEACTVDGLILEFGVFRGESLRFIAKRTERLVHGFDSFEGLPEDWTYFQKQGRFSLDGRVPEFREPNVRLHQGWFDATVPVFLAEHAGPIRFVHVDCDIYSSTRTVLAHLSPRIVRGTVIVFDEYLNYPAWRDHEFKAFQEWVVAQGLQYRYLGFASSHTSVAVLIE
jgi:hypothetical protein